MEAELQRWFHVDYRDRWRFDDFGHRRLTLRRIWVLISNLPVQSRLYADLYNEGREIWSTEAHLIDDLRITMSSTEKQRSKPHPARFVKSVVRSGWGDAKRTARLIDARRRARQRRLALRGEG